MAESLFPDSDVKFATKSQGFASTIGRDPARYGLSSDDAARIDRAAAEFREALRAVSNGGRRNKIGTTAKNDARQNAESILRGYANRIRVNPEISAADKANIHISERTKKLRDRECPQTRPVLVFKGSVDESCAQRVAHMVEFRDRHGPGGRARPTGATRLELFVELVPPGEPMPKIPGERTGGREWYLRSFTRSLMRVKFPLPAEPATVVYWGRWANAVGDVGPFSEPCITRLEGWSAATHTLRGPVAGPGQRQRIIVTVARPELPAYVERDEIPASQRDKLLACENIDGADIIEKE